VALEAVANGGYSVDRTNTDTTSLFVKITPLNSTSFDFSMWMFYLKDSKAYPAISLIKYMPVTKIVSGKLVWDAGEYEKETYIISKQYIHYLDATEVTVQLLTDLSL